MQWLLDNYETAEGVSLPRNLLYSHYMRHCSGSKIDPVNAASFGKLIRSVFIGLKTRRLGTRYAVVCYRLSVYLYCKRALYVTPPLSVGSVAEEIQNITTMGSESSLILH